MDQMAQSVSIFRIPIQNMAPFARDMLSVQLLLSSVAVRTNKGDPH